MRGENTQLFREVVSKIDGRLGDAYGPDPDWRELVERKVEARKDKFENELNTYRIPRLVRMHSNEMEDIQEAHAGHIVAVIGIDCSSGDTFTDGKVKYTMTSMNVPGPVMSLAVSPFPCTVMDAHIERSVYQFSKALNRFQREDPTFCVAPDHETNQTNIYAMGEQYLNMYVERIEKEYEVGVIVGEPRVNFLETVLSVLNLITHIRSKPEGRTNMYKYVGI